MRSPMIGKWGLLGLLIVTVVVLASTMAPVSANVYATDLKFSAPAVDATNPNATVDLSFRLNEKATETGIDIYRADTNTVVRHADLGLKERGRVTWTWNMKDNSSQAVPKNIEYYFKVRAKSDGYTAWTQISDDTQRVVQFEYPKSVDVNRDPNSPYFGWVYVDLCRDGTSASGRALTKGIFPLFSDLTDAFGRSGGAEDTPMTGNVAWLTGTTTASPYHVRVGPEGKVYLFDWSDAHGGVWVAPGNLSGTWPALLDPADIVNYATGVDVNTLVAPPAIHGSTACGVVAGKGVNRVLYTVDEDIIVTGDTANRRSNGSIWMYPIGALDVTYKKSPTVFWNDYYGSQNINFNNDLRRDAAGNFWLCQYRSNGTDVFSLAKIAPDGNPANNYACTWRSLANWGSPDPLRGNASGGLAIDDGRKRIATAGSSSGVVNVFNVDASQTPIKSTLTTVGGGALVWAAGGSSTLLYSSNIGASFTAQTAPVAGKQLNDIHIETTADTAAGGVDGWAVGNGGTIFQLGHTGTTYAWAAATQSATTANLNAVTGIWNTATPIVIHGWAVGDNGTILMNTDGNWSADASPVSVNLRGIGRRISSYAGPVYDLFVVGDGGTILQKMQASDPTATWTQQTSNTTANLNAVYVLVFSTTTNTIAFAAGDNGTIVRTGDNGTTWTVANSGTTAKLNGIYAVTGSDAWAVGNGGVIVHSENGTDFTTQNSGTTANLKGVWFKDNQTGWASGDGGVLLRTRNGGDTWEAITSGTTQNLNGLCALPTGSGSPRDVAFDAVGNLYSVDNSNELLRVYSPPDGPNEYTSKSIVSFVPTNGDATKPATPVVTAPATSSSGTQLSASWTATGASYRYAISVTADDEGEYVKGWTNTTSTNVTATGLSLDNGVTYFWLVQAKSANGVWSDIGASAGTVVQAPSKIGVIKQKSPNTGVSVENVVVTRSSTTDFWVQEQDRSAGIRVVSTANPAVNTLVSFAGTVAVDNTTTEKYIDASGSAVSTGANFTPVPLKTGQASVGGKVITQGKGLPDDGLLVTVWGKTTKVLSLGSPYFYMDDGSGVANDTADPVVPGIKVTAIDPSYGVWPYSTGEYWSVTGIVRLQKAGSNVIPVIEVKGDENMTSL